MTVHLTLALSGSTNGRQGTSHTGSFPSIDQSQDDNDVVLPREAALATLVHACERQEPMTSEELRAWQSRMGLSGRAAARLLGMNTTTYLDRANGKSHTTGLPVPVPRTLMLACAALEAARMLKLAHTYRAKL